MAVNPREKKDKVAGLRRGYSAVAMTLIVALASPLSAVARVEMPEWSSADAKKFSEPGSPPLAVGLWPDEMLGGKGVPMTGPDGGVGEGEAAGTDAETEAEKQLRRLAEGKAASGEAELSAPLPDGPVGRVEFTPMELVTPPVQIRVVPSEKAVAPEETERLFLRRRPVDFLVDPLALLTEQRSHDVSRFLEYHADEAPFDICLMVLREHEVMPPGTSLAELHKKWFGEERVALVVYPYGQPALTQFEFGSAVRERVSGAVLGRIEQSCRAEAAVGTDPSDQAEKLSIELSIRLYWLGRILDRPQSMTEAEATEHADQRRVAEAAGSPGGSRTSGLAAHAAPWWWIFLAALGSVLLGGWLSWLVRRNSLNGEPLFFPDRELPARLGGASAGGDCAQMSFRFGGSGTREHV